MVDMSKLRIWWGEWRLKRLHDFWQSCEYIYGLNTEEVRREKIVVSLTSYPKRFNSLPLVLKTLLYQSMKPDRICVYISKEESTYLPDAVKYLEKYGVEIILVDDNIKPHKKYLYSMQQFPDCIVITVDDDVLYPRDLVRNLFQSYQRHPNAVSANRVHKMKVSDGRLDRYLDWDLEYKHGTVPSKSLFATGVGGILYPPHLFDATAFDTDLIKKLCLNADDVWLKIMELRRGIKVVYTGCRFKLDYAEDTQCDSLCSTNWGDNMNDVSLKEVMSFFDISPKEFID